MDTNTFEAIARRKIAGWFSTKEYEDKAIERLSKQRTEIIDLLKSTKRENIDVVIQIWMTVVFSIVHPLRTSTIIGREVWLSIL